MKPAEKTEIKNLKEEFIRVIKGLDKGMGEQEHFRNFCTMAFNSISKITAWDQEEAEKKEEQYMKVVGTYRNKDDVRQMPELLALVYKALQIGNCDFLGEIASELNVLEGRSGQFFTPYDISRLMAKLQLGDNAENLIQERGYISVADPAAGAGCMLLAVADEFLSLGYNVQENLSVQAIDISRLAFHMCFIQLSMKGIPAEVLHGDTLQWDIWERAYTPVSIEFTAKHGRLFPESKSEDQTSKPEVKSNTQLSLF